MIERKIKEENGDDLKLSLIDNPQKNNNLHITAKTSPWNSGSMKRVRRRNARDHAGSRCSSTDVRCESE